MSYEIMPYKIMSYEIMSYEITSYEITSYEITSYEITSYEIMSYKSYVLPPAPLPLTLPQSLTLYVGSTSLFIYLFISDSLHKP